MLMETFDRLSRKEKYVWDVSANIADTMSCNSNGRIVLQMYGHVRFAATLLGR